MKARYTGGVIAGSLVFLATAFSGLEAYAQSPPSQAGVNFWNTAGTAAGLGKQNALERGDFKSAWDFQKSQNSSAFIGSMMAGWASDEQASIDKKNKEQWNQMQRNQEEFLENQRALLRNGTTPQIANPVQQTQEAVVRSVPISGYFAIKGTLEIYGHKCNSLSTRLENNTNPESLLDISSKLKSAAIEGKEYVALKLNDPNTSEPSRKLLAASDNVYNSQIKLADAQYGMGEILMRRKENPELYLTIDADAAARRAIKLALKMNETKFNTDDPDNIMYLQKMKEEIASVKKYSELGTKRGPLSEKGKASQKVVNDALNIYGATLQLIGSDRQKKEKK